MLRPLVGLEEIVAGDSRLHEGRAKCGTLQMPMPGKRKRAASSVGVGPRERNVVLLADEVEPEVREGCDDPLARRVDRELRQSDCHAGLGDKPAACRGWIAASVQEAAPEEPLPSNWTGRRRETGR